MALIQVLHVYNNLSVRYSLQDHLSHIISVKIRVKQGCIHAVLLFNYINAIKLLHNLEFHLPNIVNRSSPMLLYVDDTVTLSCTEVRLRRTLREFHQVRTWALKALAFVEDIQTSLGLGATSRFLSIEHRAQEIIKQMIGWGILPFT